LTSRTEPALASTAAPLPPLDGPQPCHLLAADLYGNGKNAIIVCDRGTCRVLSFVRGRLHEVENFPSLDVPVVCRLDESGDPCLLTTGRDEQLNLWVEARGPDRQRRWRFTFPDSAACGQYLQAIYISVGRFTGGCHNDVFAYTTKPEARSVMLDGATGRLIWEKRELPEIERHFQGFGGRMSAWDLDGDGADELFFCNPDFYCVASGRTGELLAGPVSLPRMLGWWSAYASPAVLPRHEEPPVVYLGGSYSGRIALPPDGRQPLWDEFLPTDRWPLLVGSDRFMEGLLPPGEGRGWRGLQAQVDGSLVCFDVASGRHAWVMPLKTTISGIVTGDLDGDGRCEVVFGGADGTLIALRDAGGHPEKLWEKRFRAPVGAVILADIDGDRAVELVVSIGDGTIQVLK
jgi:hypothetical protein